MTGGTVAPEPYRSIIDERMDHDRAVLEEHPHRTSFVRPAVPGELWPLELPPGTMIEVTRIGPGLRTRRVFSADGATS